MHFTHIKLKQFAAIVLMQNVLQFFFPEIYKAIKKSYDYISEINLLKQLMLAKN